MTGLQITGLRRSSDQTAAAAAAPAREPSQQATGKGKAGAVAREFEATLMATLLEQALPKGAATFGKGLAGSVARTYLARQLAHAVAASGTLGLAGHLMPQSPAASAAEAASQSQGERHVDAGQQHRGAR